VFPKKHIEDDAVDLIVSTAPPGRAGRQARAYHLLEANPSRDALHEASAAAQPFSLPNRASAGLD
jgi:hypothetical protein